MIRRGKIDLRYALPWLALGMCLLILDIFPGIPGWLARLMGIELPINMLFFFGFCFSLIIIFLLTMSLSRMTVKIKQLSPGAGAAGKEGGESGKVSGKGPVSFGG